MERVIDPLESGEPGRSNRAGVLEIKRLGDARDPFCRDSNVRGIETAFGIEPAKRIDLVADFEPTDPRAHRGDDARAVATEHEGKPRLAARIPSAADLRVPRPHARRVERDQNIAWTDFGNGQGVHRNEVRPTEAIDGRCEHQRRQARRSLATGIRTGTGTVKHARLLSASVPRAGPDARAPAKGRAAANSTADPRRFLQSRSRGRGQPARRTPGGSAPRSPHAPASVRGPTG